MARIGSLGFAGRTGFSRGRPHGRARDYRAFPLSETVPEKLPVAWPYRNGHAENSEQTATTSNALLFIKIPLFR